MAGNSGSSNSAAGSGASGASRQTLIGLFVIGGVLLGLCSLFFFGDINFFSKDLRAVVVFQNSVAGLAIGAPVTFRGVKVGSVDKITLRYDPRTNIAYIPVEITLEPHQVHVLNVDSRREKPINLQELVKNGLRAEQNMQSFVTGTLNINLDFFPDSPKEFHPLLADFPEIPTHISAIQKIKQTLSDLPLKELAAHADEAVISVRGVADSLNTELPALVTSLRTTSSDAQETLKTATRTIASLQGRLDATLLDIDRLMRTGNAQLESRGADLHATLESATRTTEEARRTLEGMRGILSPRSADRDNLDSALRDIAAAAASLRGFAGDVERNPQLLLMGRRP